MVLNVVGSSPTGHPKRKNKRRESQIETHVFSVTHYGGSVDFLGAESGSVDF